MIILSIGMPRAGSGWYYNLTHDLVVANGGQPARTIRERYHLQRILTEVNCNIGALTPRRLLSVLVPSLLGNTFVIKAHAAPTPFAMLLMRTGQMQGAYIYRDPRDALLSAYENGQRTREKNRSNAFSHLIDFETALAFMQEYVRISTAWLALPYVHHTCYETLLSEYPGEAGKLARFLDLPEDSPLVRQAIESYRPEQATPDQKGMHFRKGKIGRFRDKMSAEQCAAMWQAFQPYLERMGYPP
ncbi:MAG: sulfotransferase domain-containing protein [Anaerolineales bacterium]|nr:sulfotransferase domain-containing protein [Anaerolineales bacterium]